MMTTKLTIVFLLIALISCGQTRRRHNINPDAIKLNDSAARAAKQMNDSGYQKAILLLDQATEIDSNYFLAYYNKLLFQSALKQYDKALVTSKNLIRIRSIAPDLRLIRGRLYTIIGDSVSATQNFQAALSLYNSLLDTMSIANRSYDLLCLNKAIDLILLGNQIQGNALLMQIYDRQSDESYKEMILPVMNKSRKELLEMMENQQPVINSSNATIK